MPLAPEVRTAAIAALRESLPVWLGIPMRDHKRVYRRSGEGSYTIAIEAYRGSYSWMDFDKYVRSSEAVRLLGEVIAQHQPLLNGYLVLPGRAFRLGEPNGLLSTWCLELERRSKNIAATAELVDGLLSEFSELLDSQSLTHRVTTAISGLRLPASIPEIELPDGAVLRDLSEEELTELSSQDITFGRDQDILSHSVSCCLVHQSRSQFRLELSSPESLPPPTTDDDARRSTSDLLRALHALKSGRAGIFQSTSHFYPNLFPMLGGGTSWPLYRAPFASLDLLPDDVELLLKILRALAAGTRDEVRIASDRLQDAENRLSPVDSLLDAVIGLEALLNPMDTAELSFRVALNYAFLAPPAGRRSRYERVRVIQKTRNRVVHGGLNLQSAEAPLIHEHATLAKACLRDVVQSFLVDPTLAGNWRLDAEFWLDRVIPSNTVAMPAAVAALGTFEP